MAIRYTPLVGRWDITEPNKVVLTGCLRRSGRRRHLHTAYGNEINHIMRVRVRATRVAFVDSAYDRYGNGFSTLMVIDLAAKRPAKEIERSDLYFHDVVLGPAGEIAWIAGDGLSRWLMLQRPGGDRREVDIGFTLAAPRFTARRLAWRRGSVEASVPLSTPDACSPPTKHGTMLVDLVTTDTSVRACWRETGATTLAPHASYSLAGRWLADHDGSGITLYNLQTGTSEHIPAASVSTVLVDEHGSLWWDTIKRYQDTEPQQVWVRDAHGTRQLGSIEDQILGVGRDGPVVRWVARHAGAVTLQPA